MENGKGKKRGGYCPDRAWKTVIRLGKASQKKKKGSFRKNRKGRANRKRKVNYCPSRKKSAKVALRRVRPKKKSRERKKTTIRNIRGG